MTSSWIELEKGDIIHSLIFNPKTTCYQYQEIKLISVKSVRVPGSPTPNFITLVFKYSKLPEGKRERTKITIFWSEIESQMIPSKAARYGSPILISLKKEYLESGLKTLMNNYEMRLRLELSHQFLYLNYFINYVKNQNPLQS